MDLETEGLEPDPSVSWDSPFSVFSGQHHSIGSRDRSHIVRAEALRVWCELFPLLLSVLDPHPALAPLPKRGTMLEQEGIEQALGIYKDVTVIVLAPVRVPHCT